ncbi:gamma-glutamyltranspeptidase / glutathione hydrolase [Solimonas aquatica]|uniref:Glutathione hydrolase proenzyme n=1 Tax=Solimonas aquatica TaxID=489703 RepID=A0A1H9M7T9_9GAMM|nr:gamma-glutamyltransferase [Solimonas aquatica]SER19537.1 gamma-glutamyltranspeptidase / glutathione hydrolase [Solimonas aquatica]
MKTRFGFLLLCLPLLGQAATPATPPGYACATAQPLATQACMKVLAEGGNAFDAAVAASAALAVVEPTGSGLGGGGFWLLHRARDDADIFIDGREVAPRSASATMYQDDKGQAQADRSRWGVLAAGIPGEPAALEHIARRYGAKPLAASLAPAIAYARDGFAIDPKLARAISEMAPHLSDTAKTVLFADGKPLASGALLKQSDLANTLQLLAQKGRDGFYQGPVAEALLKTVNSQGGNWTAQELHAYQVIEREALRFDYRGYRITTLPPPSAGGVTLAQLFQQLEILGWQDDGSVRSRHLWIESLRRAYHDRASYLGDPDFVRVPTPELISRTHARELASGIDPQHATPSAALKPVPLGGEGHNTTHFSVLDAQGNRVAGTLSVNLPFGSGVMAAGTGVLLNDEMDDFAASTTASNAYGLIGSEANAIAPGKRPLSSMVPSFVEGPRGLLIIGTPGGSRIPTMVALGIAAWIRGDSAPSIVAEGRIHHQYLPDQVQYELGALSEEQQAGLKALGHVLTQVKAPYGNLQVVSWTVAKDQLEAAADPRGVGSGEVVLLRKPAR